MRPWSADQSPRSGEIRPRRRSGMPVPEQDPSLAGRPAPGSMNWGADQPSGTWAGEMPPFSNSSVQNKMPPPPGMSMGTAKSVSRPMTPGEFPESTPRRELAQPIVPLGRFGRATGLSLKLRFLLALTLLSLAPAFLLVVLYQQANQTSLTGAGQQTLASAAQSDGNVLTQEVANRQAYLSRLSQKSSIAQVVGAKPSATILQQANDLLSTASLSTGDSLAWMVLNGSDQIVAASPASAAGQPLTSATALLSDPSVLDKFVQAQRNKPASQSGQNTLAVISGVDSNGSAKAWCATLAFTAPGSPAQSGVVLAMFAIPTMVDAYLSALPLTTNSYAVMFDTQGTIMGAAHNQTLSQQVGQRVSIPALQNAVQAAQAGQGSSEQIFDDPTTGVSEAATGITLKNLGWTILVVAPPDALAPATTGLLSARNAPLIFLSIIVITTLVATWVALPIVRPIRRATRDILASTDDVRLLAEQAKQIAKDQRLGSDILEGAAKGLDLRRRAIGRDASLIANSSTAAAARLAQLAYAINELPESYQAPMQMLSREIYQELQTAHQLATGISSGLESDPVQKRLGNVMEGAAEISQQFDQASQQLERGASRLERAADSLQ
jgi:hypothetical protein